MAKRIAAFCLILVLLAAAVALPHGKADVRAVEHQHESWPRETEACTGLAPDGTLTTHLPILILHTRGKTVPGLDREDKSVLSCSYSLIRNESGVNSSRDTPALEGSLSLSIRGNSSRYFPKKQYLLRLTDSQGLPENQAMLDMPAESTWVLNGSSLDKSCIRNYMLYTLSRQIMEGYSPDCRFCEVMMEDETGSLTYEGLYTLIEKVKVSKNRLDLTPSDPRYPETSFLVQLNAYVDHIPLFHMKPNGLPAYPIDLEYPGEEELNRENTRYVQQQITLFEKALYDGAFTGAWQASEQKMDMDSFVDYYVLNEFFQNYDAGNRSTYLYQNLGGRLSIGPVWDFDGALNNYEGTDLSRQEIRIHKSLFYAFLLQNPHFTDRCIARYWELRQGPLSEKNLLALIDGIADYLGTAPLRNSDRWYQGQHALYSEDLEMLRQFVRERGAWMDENVEIIRFFDAARGQ